MSRCLENGYTDLIQNTSAENRVLLFILVINSLNKCLLDSRHYFRSWGYSND